MSVVLRRRAMSIAALAAIAIVPAHAAAQDAHQARNLAATCANCHGMDGNARGDMKPLAGMSVEKLTAMIADFKSGAQPSTIMQQIAKGYSDQQIALIAAYFAAQKARK